MRWLSAVVFVGGLGSLGCGPQFIGSSATATSDKTSGKDSGSDAERDAWIVITAIVVVTSVVLVVSAFSDDDMWAYMQDHQRDVRVALANGEGPFPSDLTHSLGLPATEVPRVARILHEGRAWLAPHVDAGPITEVAAREFWGQLLTMLAADPVTGPRIDALKVRALELIEGRSPGFAILAKGRAGS